MKYIPGMDEGYANSLKNKLFGLLCEYEKGREWEKFLDSIIIELMGFDEEEIIYEKTIAQTFFCSSDPDCFCDLFHTPFSGCRYL